LNDQIDASGTDTYRPYQYIASQYGYNLRPLESQEFVLNTLPEIQRQQQEQAEWYKQRQGTVTQDNRNWLQRKRDEIIRDIEYNPNNPTKNYIKAGLAAASLMGGKWVLENALRGTLWNGIKTGLTNGAQWFTKLASPGSSIAEGYAASKAGAGLA